MKEVSKMIFDKLVKRLNPFGIVVTMRFHPQINGMEFKFDLKDRTVSPVTLLSWMYILSEYNILRRYESDSFETLAEEWATRMAHQCVEEMLEILSK